MKARIICGSTFGSGYLELQYKRFGFWCSFDRVHITSDQMPEKIATYFKSMARQLEWEIVK